MVSADPCTSRMSLIAGLPSSTAAKGGSTATVMRRSGRNWCRAASAGVSMTTSPSDRRRRIRTLEPGGRPGRMPAGLAGFNAGFVHEHHRDVVPDRVDAMARAALQPLFVRGELHRSLAKRQARMVKQLFAYSHARPPERT